MSSTIQATNLEQFIQGLTNTRRAITNASKRGMADVLVPVVAAYRSNLQAMANNQPSVSVQTGADGSKTYITRTVKLADTPAGKVWVYPDRSGVAGIVGPKAKQAPHAHLVEDGTRYRMRLRIGGRYKIVEFWITHGNRMRHEQDRNTGVMPAFHPLRRAAESTRSTVTSMLPRVLAVHFHNSRSQIND